jgi:outer membrane protein TolC
MRDMTFADLDLAVAEQLPPRELMGGSWSRGGNNTAVAGNSSSGFINVANGNQIQVLTFGSNNGNYAEAG